MGQICSDLKLQKFGGSIFIGPGGNELSFLLLNYLLIKVFVSLLLSKFMDLNNYISFTFRDNVPLLSCEFKLTYNEM